jgi:CBS domain containing-hemolysin-like protein
MSPLVLVFSIVLLLMVLTLSSYADRVYSEMGKFLAREYQENLDAWTERIEPRFGLSRDSVALSASILRQGSLALLALILGVHRAHVGGGWPAYAETVVELALIIIVFDRMLPQVLFARTRGDWVSNARIPLQVLFYLILPLTLTLGLLESIVSLAEPDDKEEEDHPDEGVDALLEAGEEEGILEESDRALVRSVVEFGDMVVREVMTPRPEMFTVPESMTLAEFTAALNENAFSRVPVYRDTVDEITGIAFAHDLLQITDVDANTRTVREMQRPAAFVPEPKKVNELLREMQSEKQHMRIVIDEYGAVAGLVTIEDLIEAIVGNIEDEHDEDVEVLDQEDGSWIVPGSMDVAKLRDLLQKDADEDEREPLRLRTDLEASTVGGLVSELAGHIPHPGEVIEEDGLRLEVVNATSRLVKRVRVSLLPPEDPTEN